jgi:hypothetical protein
MEKLMVVGLENLVRGGDAREVRTTGIVH